MIVGVCEIEVFIPLAHSLKEKRKIVNSIKDKISNRFNVSFAEVGYQDKWQRALFGAAKVGNDTISVQQFFDFIHKLIIEDGRMEIINFTKRMI